MQVPSVPSAVPADARKPHDAGTGIIRVRTACLTEGLLASAGGDVHTLAELLRAAGYRPGGTEDGISPPPPDLLAASAPSRNSRASPREATRGALWSPRRLGDGVRWIARTGPPVVSLPPYLPGPRLTSRGRKTSSASSRNLVFTLSDFYDGDPHNRRQPRDLLASIDAAGLTEKTPSSSPATANSSGARRPGARQHIVQRPLHVRRSAQAARHRAPRAAYR